MSRSSEELDNIVRNLVAQFEEQKRDFNDKIINICKDTFKIERLPTNNSGEKSLEYLYLVNPYIKHINPLCDEIELYTEGFIMDYIKELIVDVNVVYNKNDDRNARVFSIYSCYEDDNSNIITTVNICRDFNDTNIFVIYFDYNDDENDEEYEGYELKISKKNLLDILWSISDIIDEKENGISHNGINNNLLEESDEEDYNQKEEIIKRGFMANAWNIVRGLFLIGY